MLWVLGLYGDALVGNDLKKFDLRLIPFMVPLLIVQTCRLRLHTPKTRRLTTEVNEGTET